MKNALISGWNQATKGGNSALSNSGHTSLILKNINHHLTFIFTTVMMVVMIFMVPSAIVVDVLLNLPPLNCLYASSSSAENAIEHTSSTMHTYHSMIKFNQQGKGNLPCPRYIFNQRVHAPVPFSSPSTPLEDAMAQDQTTQILVWETIIKTIMKRLDIPSRSEINHLNAKLDRLEKVLYQKQSGNGFPMDEAAHKMPPRSKIASTVVLGIISTHPNGTDFKTIKEKTGFNDKKLRNIIFRLDRTNKIKRIKRGVYKKT